MASLRVTSGPLAGTTVEVKEDLVIGRVDAGLTIDDAEISRRHAIVRRVGGALEIEDLGSSNGTYVDGQRIANPTLLGGGTKLTLGTTELVVQGVLTDATRIRQRPDVTKLGAVQDPDLELTRARPKPSPPPPAAVAPPAAAAPAEQPRQPVGDFQPPVRRRSRGLASRSWVPVALSFGTVILTAVALVIYFAAR